MRPFIQEAIFGGKAEIAFSKIKEKAVKRGIFLSSLAPFYKAIAKGDLQGFSVPAFNIRTLTFDIACSIFRAAKKEKASAFILEIASSEMEYTKQSPQEFSLCVLEAAVKERYKGQVFLQGDHFYLKNTSEQEVKNLEGLILQSIASGFYNFDIDCSGLDLEKNIQYTNYFIDFIKRNSPLGIEMAVGGEVSAIGKEETTEQELEMFLRGVQGVIKVSCQTNTRHGGTILLSGAIEQIEIDLKKLKGFGKIARNYGLAGVVQHGASTLKNEQFSQLVEVGVLEVHLSTLFQNLFFESAYLPKDLKERIYAWLDQNLASERLGCQSDAQFYYKTRKKALGVFKGEIWQMPQKNIQGICRELEKKFRFFFQVLGISNTQGLIREIYQ